MKLILMATLMGLWAFISFLAGPLISFFGKESLPELPWSHFGASDVGDFVEATDGRVYVVVPFYSRTLCYDERGNFIANHSWPIRNAKGAKLASGRSGLVYLLLNNSVYAYDRNWKVVFEVEEDPARERVWKLSDESKPLLAKTEEAIVQDRAVAPNELLFSPSQQQARERFLCHDDSVLERIGERIVRVSRDGRKLSEYRSPRRWFLLKYPWPAGLAIPLGVLFVALAIYMKRKGRNGKKSRTALS